MIVLDELKNYPSEQVIFYQINFFGKFHPIFIENLSSDFLSIKKTQHLVYKKGFFKRNNHEKVDKRTFTIVNAKISKKSIIWFVPQYTRNGTRQRLMPEQIIAIEPASLQYIERSVFQ